MLRRFLRATFVENAPLKALSAVLAIALYVFVRGDRPVDVVLDVPLVYRLPTDRILLSALPDRLRVVVRGPWTRLSGVDEHELERPVTIDLMRVPSGDFTFPEELFKLPHGVRVISVAPAAVHLVLEPRVLEKVPVEPRLSGRPAQGFEVRRVQVTPLEITLSGPASVLGSLRSLPTAAIPVDGARAGFARRVGLGPLPDHVAPQGPRTVEVEVEIAPER